MSAFPWFLLATVAANGSSPSRQAWEKVFSATSYGAVSSVKATERDRWIAGGPWGVVTSTTTGARVESTHGHGVLGLFVESRESVYAFGEGELIWHFDGKKWTEEHSGAVPPRGQRRPFAEHMLYLSYYSGVLPNDPLVAFGLSLALVKQPDGEWAALPSPEREKVLERGQLGPRNLRPVKCDPAGWNWLGRNRGALSCHDRRVFVFEGEQPIPKGQLPGSCDRGLHSLVEAKGELYAACEGPTLWRTEGQTWTRIDPPKEKGLKEIAAISVADGCLFVAGSKAVWRRCGD
jgi:hypothetical protein